MSNVYSYLQTLLPQLFIGAGKSLEIFTITLISSIPVGLVITLGSLSKIAPLRWFTTAYIWLFRGTPLMLQLFFMFFCIPIITHQTIMLSPFTTAAITFCLNYAAYLAEIYRGGIQSIDKGQYEAAKTLGFTRWGTMQHIIIPQTVRRVVPAISNEAISLVKDTALISVIGVAELLKNTIANVNATVNPTAYAIAAVFYLVFTFVLTVLSKKLEKRFAKHESQ